MRVSHIGLMTAVGVLVLAVLPVAGATAPVHGVVTTCSSTYACHFTFNTSAGTGWANGSGASYYGHAGVLSLQLPGEAQASYNLSYTTWIGSLIGTYTYWTEGYFVGTDVNTGHVVFGTTNTNYTITCHGHSGHGGGCTYTYTTDNGTIVVRFTQAEQTATTVSCNPSTVRVAGKTTCTITVTDLWNSSNIPTGKVRITTSDLGTFSNKGTCTLSSSGTCTFTYHPNDNSCGSSTIGASYLGTRAFYKSVGSTVVAISGGC